MATRAARFIYLNRTCWNGLYRVNKLGKFNVPKGTKQSVILDTDCFSVTSRLLRNAILLDGDFEKIIDQAKERDLLFIDPPYTVRHNNNSFIEYNEKLFSWADQKRLFISLKRAKERNVLIVSTNANSKSIRKLYGGTFKTKVVSRHSVISSKSESRGKFEELIIYSGNNDE
jgi:DNA adenine methylase